MFMEKYSELFPHGAMENWRDRVLRAIREKYDMWAGNESDEMKRLCKEYRAVSMMESCWCYDGIAEFYKQRKDYETGGNKPSYYEQYLEEYQKLGGEKEEFDKAIAIQLCYLETCCKKVDAGTDSEGLSYLAIVEK